MKRQKLELSLTQFWSEGFRDELAASVRRPIRQPADTFLSAPRRPADTPPRRHVPLCLHADTPIRRHVPLSPQRRPPIRRSADPFLSSPPTPTRRYADPPTRSPPQRRPADTPIRRHTFLPSPNADPPTRRYADTSPLGCLTS